MLSFYHRVSKHQIDFSTLSTYCSAILSEVNHNTSCSDLDVLHRETGFGPSDLPRHLQEVLDLSIFSIRPSKTKLPPLIDYWNIPSPRKNGNFEGGNSPWKGKHVPSKSLAGLSSTPKVVARRTQSGNVTKMGRKSGIELKLNPIVASSLPTNRGKSLSAYDKRSETPSNCGTPTKSAYRSWRFDDDRKPFLQLQVPSPQQTISPQLSNHQEGSPNKLNSCDYLEMRKGEATSPLYSPTEMQIPLLFDSLRQYEDSREWDGWERHHSDSLVTLDSEVDGMGDVVYSFENEKVNDNALESFREYSQNINSLKRVLLQCQNTVMSIRTRIIDYKEKTKEEQEKSQASLCFINASDLRNVRH